MRREDVADFRIDGQRIALMDPQRGIRKPKQLDAALSIRTVFSIDPSRRPYEDERGPTATCATSGEEPTSDTPKTSLSDGPWRPTFR